MDNEASAVGKIQGSAYVTAVVERPSPNIDAMSASLIKEARDRWDEMYSRSMLLIYPSESIFKQTQYKVSSSKYRVKEYRAEIAAAVKKYKGKSILRKNATTLGTKYFIEYQKTNIKAVNDLFSDIQGIYSVIDNPAFKSAMMELSGSYAKKIADLWTKDGASLSKLFVTRYQKADASKAAVIFWDMRDEIAVISTSEATPAEVALINKFLVAMGSKPLNPATPLMSTTIGTRAKVTLDRRQDELIKEYFVKLKVIWERTYIAARLKAIEAAMIATQQETNARDTYIKNDGSLITQGIYVPEMTTLRPFDVVSITAEAAPMFRGYPIQPLLWARCIPHLSSEGEMIFSDRPTPAEVRLDSDQRWVADEDFYDPTTGEWQAINSKLNYRIQAANISDAPSLITQTTTTGKELITRTSFRISGGSKFHCKWNSGLDSMSTFTISMVIAPNPTARAYPVLDYWHGDGEPPVGGRFAWWLNDRLDFFYGDMGGSVDQMASLNKTRPLVVTSVIANNTCTTYVGYSPKHNFSTVIQAKVDNVAQWMRFQIGGTYYDITEDEYADFNLYEVNMWTRALENDEVVSLHSDYYSMYGVSDDWR